MTKLGGSLLLFCLISFTAMSQVVVDSSSWDDDVVAIYGDACENIKSGDARSSIRLRATDKASFKAIENISTLSDYKKKLSEHDFNVYVYSLIDNNVSDLAIRTTKADSERICVEVTGYILSKDLSLDYVSTPVSIVPEGIESESFSDEKPEKPLLYIANTEFFDGTSSVSSGEDFRKLFSQGENFYITPRKELADYVIYSKVLRAKIDPINSSTNRLQMLVSVELEDSGNKDIIKEHQNKFVLFNSTDDEQAKARELMVQLFSIAGNTILDKLERLSASKINPENLPSIISPNNQPKASALQSLSH